MTQLLSGHPITFGLPSYFRVTQSLSGYPVTFGSPNHFRVTQLLSGHPMGFRVTQWVLGRYPTRSGLPKWTCAG